MRTRTTTTTIRHPQPPKKSKSAINSKDGVKEPSYTLVVGMQAYATTAEIRMEVPPNSKTEATIWPSWPLLAMYTKLRESAHHRRFLHIHVYCRMIHESQAVKSTSMSFTRWTGAESVAYRHNGVLFGRKEAWNHAICRKWMQLVIIMLSETNQVQTNIKHFLSLIETRLSIHITYICMTWRKRGDTWGEKGD